MDINSNIYVAGHRGLVGSSICRNLKAKGYKNIVTADHKDLDLCNQLAVEEFFKSNKIDYIFLAAAKVGGILYNQSYQAEFLYDNLMIACNVINAAYRYDVKKLLFLGSSCIYPKHAEQPIKESSLLTGPLEPTNEGYALAKIAGLKLCEKYFTQHNRNFISAMPTNLYGPGDNFHPTHSHVIPGLLRRFHNAKIENQASVTIWGSGTPKREFLHVDDCAEALFVLMKDYSEPTTINIGTGEDLTIKELAELVAEVTEFKGEILLDKTKPDGTPRKVLDVSRLRSLGWSPKYDLKNGLHNAYQWALENKAL
jgi:GDP-L-fucose synthase